MAPSRHLHWLRDNLIGQSLLRVKFAPELPIGGEGIADLVICKPVDVEEGGTRMEMRGIEFGGVKMAVEVPGWFDWRPSSDGAQRACCACEADLRLTLRPLHDVPQFSHSVAYPYAEGTLEVGRCESDWVLAVHVDGDYQRVVRFDSTFTVGEVQVAPRVVFDGVCPIAHPLDRGIAAHRAVLGGGLVVWGSAAVAKGRALVFLGDEQPVSHSEKLARGWLILRPDVRGGVRIFSLTHAAGRPTLCDVELHAIHTSDSMFSHAEVPDTLDEEDAAGELLRYAFTPNGGSRIANKMLETACSLASRIALLRTGVRQHERFAWKSGPTGVSARVLASER